MKIRNPTFRRISSSSETVTMISRLFIASLFLSVLLQREVSAKNLPSASASFETEAETESLTEIKAGTDIHQTHTTGKCVMHGKCGDMEEFGDQTCRVDQLSVPLDEEFHDQLKEFCPELFDQYGSTLCCDPYQVNKLTESLSLAQSLLGRCPSCFSNLRRSFCEFTCSPHQYKFLNVTEEAPTSSDALELEPDLPKRVVSKLELASQTPDGTLSYNSVRESDAGVYVCTAVSNSGQTTQAQAILSLSFLSSPPSARIEPERQTIVQGSFIEIRCIPTGNPSPVIEWSKVRSTLPDSVQRNSEVLRIERADVSDSGVYVCQVENAAGKSLASAIVEVGRREAPQIEMYPSRPQTVVREGSALFQCRITSGFPSPTLTWTRANGQRLPTTAEEIQGGVLRFNRVTGEEEGEYICSAENLAGTVTAFATLEIQTPPKIRISPGTPHRVGSGERVRLECRADGEPLPTVSWKKLQPGRLEGIELNSYPYGIPEIAFYEINRVSKSDEGSYSCVAKNEAGVEEVRIQLLIDDFEDFAPPSSPAVY